MTAPHPWFVVLDSHKARLLQLTRTTKGSPHVEELAALATTFVAGEHQRPDRLGAPGRSAGTGHEHEEALAHFAREVAPWLQTQLTQRAVERCALFAPAAMLGAFRKQVTKDLARKVVEHAVELAGLPTAQLASHPRIVALFEA